VSQRGVNFGAQRWRKVSTGLVAKLSLHWLRIIADVENELSKFKGQPVQAAKLRVHVSSLLAASPPSRPKLLRTIQFSRTGKDGYMNVESLKATLAAMGARLNVRRNGAALWPRFGTRASGFRIDVQRDRQGEVFDISVAHDPSETFNVSVLQVRPEDRHLLLLVRQKDGRGHRDDRFLCGHDERHWFIATVPGAVSTVAQAMEALKPKEVAAAQELLHVRTKDRNRRKNGAFLRQGEWFFVPAPALQADEHLILLKEPIRRGSGKPHVVEQLYRCGGETVYVSRKHPNGLTTQQYRELLQREPEQANQRWQVMTRNAEVYAKGKVRHPDHATIELCGWHRVLPNTESQARLSVNMAFLD